MGAVVKAVPLRSLCLGSKCGGQACDAIDRIHHTNSQHERIAYYATEPERGLHAGDPASRQGIAEAWAEILRLARPSETAVR